MSFDYLMSQAGKRLVRKALLGVVCYGLVLTGSNAADATPLTLFEYGQAATPRTAAAVTATPQAGVTHMRFTDAAFSLQPGNVARIVLPNGSVYDVVLASIKTHTNGDRTWAGYLKGYGNDYSVLITSGEGGAFGTIQTPTGEYKFTPQNGVPSLIDIKAAGLQRLKNPGNDAVSAAAPARTPNLAAASTATSYPAASAANPAVIDLMVVYSTGLARKLGSGLNARLNHLVAVANQAYANSNVYITLRLVRAEPIDFPDNTPIDGTLITSIRDGGNNGLGPFKQIKAARERYGADLVTFLRDINSGQGGWCGLGDMALDPSWIRSYSYSIVADGALPSYYCSEQTLAHELGHNLGLDHDTAATTRTDTQKYAHGYLVKDKFSTVMAYFQGGTDLLKFSSPDLTCIDQPCGNADSANNARRLNEMAPYVANAFPTKVALPAKAPARIVGLANKCLNAHPSTTYLSLYDCVGNVPQQQWTVSADRIKGLNGACVQTSNHSLANGTRIHLWPCNDPGTGNRWKINANNSIESLDVPGKCIDVQSALTTNETPAIIWSCHGRVNQRWVLQ